MILSIWVKYWSMRGWNRQKTGLKFQNTHVKQSAQVLITTCADPEKQTSYLEKTWGSDFFSDCFVKEILTLAFSKSRSLPIVDSSLQRHSRDSSSWFLRSFTTQSCMMASVSIFSLKSSPMNFMLPSERLRALSLDSSSSTLRRSRSSSWAEMQGVQVRTTETSPVYLYKCTSWPSRTSLEASNSFCFLSKISSSSWSFSNSFWQRLSSSFRKFTKFPGLSGVGTFNCGSRAWKLGISWLILNCATFALFKVIHSLRLLQILIAIMSIQWPRHVAQNRSHHQSGKPQLHVLPP